MPAAVDVAVDGSSLHVGATTTTSVLTFRAFRGPLNDPAMESAPADADRVAVEAAAYELKGLTELFVKDDILRMERAE